ncbi:hypothetical protein ACF090_20900 [Streptomyces sp. NPDC014892]|uniref:hypothetical protein n=1 Tax=Streptomyces TaxID=1883 RepID=UPI001EFAA7B3|nr:hypothetical protein [Streptomyces deccanensis]ULR54128.1 hypothetical protein L3078_35290 [Streptomyces deccanensis]
MKATTPRALRSLLAGGVLTGVALTGLAVPAQAATGGADACSSFTRAKVVTKREILNPVVNGELRNRTTTEQTLVIERSVSDTRTTSKEFRADWDLFKGVFTAGVSRTVTEEHTVSGMQQGRITVAPGRRVSATGYIRTWRVESEVTRRDGNCNYSTRRVTGDVATTDSMVWDARDIGAA